MATIGWHATPVGNIKRITREGLVPNHGPRSREAREQRPAIFLFASVEDLETALGSWFGDEFGDNEQLAVLRVEIPEDAVRWSDVGYEIAVGTVVPPSCITIMHRDILSVSDVFDALGEERSVAAFCQ